MEESADVRVLWAGPEASPQEFPAGPYRLSCVRPAHAALEAAEGAQTAGDPFAVGFVTWDQGDFGVRDLDDLMRVDPDLFVVLEGPEATLPGPDGLGPWMNPDRCIVLAAPVRPVVRSSLAQHLAGRWRREGSERRRVSLLEAEARQHRARGQRQDERLHVLYDIVERLHGAPSLEGALGVTLGEVSRFLGATTGSLMLLEGPDVLRVTEAVGPHRDRILGIEVPLAQSRISRVALAEGKPILVKDIQDNDRFHDSEEGIRFRARSVLSVPLFVQGEPLGVLNFGGDARRASFSEQDRSLVVTLGRQVAVAVEKARLLEGWRRTVEESIRALAGAIEAKDPYTRGHSDRVTHYSRLIGQAMGLSSRDLDLVVRAGILHDVGKIGVPELVLNKPGRLSDEEFAQIQRHPAVGVEIVREIGAMQETLPVIRAHHERFDGRGYPDHAAGEQIPLVARILA
ncbi:MAG: HD-GYP domain-containing protein, partial [Deferrisomatales bacterium]